MPLGSTVPIFRELEFEKRLSHLAYRHRDLCRFIYRMITTISESFRKGERTEEQTVIIVQLGAQIFRIFVNHGQDVLLVENCHSSTFQRADFQHDDGLLHVYNMLHLMLYTH